MLAVYGDEVTPIEQRIMLYYSKLVLNKYIDKTKVSFVTASKTIYEETKNNPAVMLPFYMSIILINLYDMTIEEEEGLESYFEDSEDINRKYSLK